jgi:hypothetical protein
MPDKVPDVKQFVDPGVKGGLPHGPPFAEFGHLTASKDHGIIHFDGT